MIVPVQSRTFVKSMEDRKEEKDAQAFREDVDYFLSKEDFNLFDFHERVLVSKQKLMPILILTSVSQCMLFSIFIARSQE